MLLTSGEYETITGETTPIAFDAILAMVQGELDAITLNYYTETIVADAPQLIQSTLKRYLAYQVLAVSEAGGIIAGTEQIPQSVSVGKISVSGGGKSGNPAADRLLPLLLSYTNGTVTFME
ncbi:MAG: hypothetical protein IH607_00450 [Firmicutes bacterium]|nr:hypothetical protein [Bacillota bacterium]